MSHPPAMMTSFEAPPFEEWPCQLVKVEHGTIFLRYAGAGPPILLLHGVPQHSVCFVGPLEESH